jgi:transcriptional antiterminator NusG
MAEDNAISDEELNSSPEGAEAAEMSRDKDLAAEPAASAEENAVPEVEVDAAPEAEEVVNELGFREDEIVHDDEDVEEADDDENVSPIEEFVDDEGVGEGGDEIEMNWYILKVQVNRENSICDTLKRRVKVAGMDQYFGEVLVPTEDVREFNKAGKQRITKRKLYPGYIVVNMSINDDSWFLVRETSGIGDFTGAAGKPAPLSPDEIARILSLAHPEQEEDGEEAIKTAIPFKLDDRVRVKEGYFQNYEGEVSNVDERNGRITVLINIFGRPNPVELDHWHVEKV